MTTESISEKISNIPSNVQRADWGFAFLKCFQGKDSKLPKSTLDQVIQGTKNFADDPENEILYKKRIGCGPIPWEMTADNNPDSRRVFNPPCLS